MGVDEGADNQSLSAQVGGINHLPAHTHTHIPSVAPPIHRRRTLTSLCLPSATSSNPYPRSGLEAGSVSELGSELGFYTFVRLVDPRWVFGGCR